MFKNVQRHQVNFIKKKRFEKKLSEHINVFLKNKKTKNDTMVANDEYETEKIVDYRKKML